MDINAFLTVFVPVRHYIMFDIVIIPVYVSLKELLELRTVVLSSSIFLSSGYY